MSEKEEKVGIECRLGKNGLLLECGDIKTFVEDFCVNEIDDEGMVCVADAPFYHPSYTPPLTSSKDQLPLIPTLQELENVLLNNELAQKVLDLYEANGSNEQLLCTSITDKESRTAAHLFFKKHFGGKLVTDTTPQGILRISRRGLNSRLAPESKKRLRYDPRNDKTEDTFPYVQAWLWKSGMDTLETVNELSKQLRINAKDISFAGTKDRRAVTVQRIAFRNLAINKLKGLKSEKYRISWVKPVKSQINLGELSGNRFTLVIRNVKPELSDSRMISLIKDLEGGFINYYGLQRFGTQVIGTHEIGLKLIKSDLLGAIDLLLTPNISCDYPELLEAKKLWLEKHDEESALNILKKLSRQQNTERQLCTGLARNAKDLQGAWMLTKREARMMYVHAVQSFIFNRTVSHLIKNNINSLPEYLPIVGNDTELNQNTEIGKVMLQVMEEMGLKEIKSLNSGLWDLSGDERKVIVKPGDVEYQIIDLHTLKLSFSLPKSAYATMALRSIFLQIKSI